MIFLFIFGGVLLICFGLSLYAYFTLLLEDYHD